MDREKGLVEKTLDEYATFFQRAEQMDTVEWGYVERALEKHLGWTPDGACALACLARNYGAFVLRNALVLATVLGIEDGQLGY